MKFYGVTTLAAAALLTIGVAFAPTAGAIDHQPNAKLQGLTSLSEGASIASSSLDHRLSSATRAEIDVLLSDLDYLNGTDGNPLPTDLALGEMLVTGVGNSFGEIALIPTQTGDGFCGTIRVPAEDWVQSWCSVGFDSTEVRTLYRVSGEHGASVIGLLPIGASNVQVVAANGATINPVVRDGVFHVNTPAQPVGVQVDLADGKTSYTPIKQMSGQAIR